jgi:SecD/SecF fusion protein
MLRFATWKIVSILSMTVLAVLVIIPSLLSSGARDGLKSFLPGWVPARSIVLGLDLQGGSHVVLEVDSASVVKTQVENLRDDVRHTLTEEKIPITGGVGILPRGVQFRIASPDNRARIMPKLQRFTAPVGSTLSGGLGAEIKEGADGLIQIFITDAAVADKVRHAVEQSIEVLRRRIDALGTTEPNIQRQGNDRILVEVPGLQDPQKLKDILGTTAKLEFRLEAKPGDDPADYELLDQADQPGAKLPVEKRIMVQGEDLTDAQPGFSSQSQEPVVNFRFNIRGGQRFGEVTSANIGRPFAIVLDNKVISAPVIRGAITGGSGEISGHFTVESATRLSILLRAGALPAKLTIVEERTVGPGLGQDSIDAGKTAAYVGAGLVIVYMLMTYGTFGIFANIALLVHIAFIFAGLVLLGATLTLPGIAGIVLTIGMAVDSNVLIYERIREESHSGRSIISSLDAGFKRAFATIVDSNVTMFVAAAILYFLGSGPVRGFAVSLALGILTTIVTAVTMTRMMIALWYQFVRPTKLPI